MNHLFTLLFKQLKYFLILICICFSCTESPRQISNTRTEYSRTQQYLFDLLDQYKAEYFAASDTIQKAAVYNKYGNRLDHFLIDSLGRQIDSITVVVDTVEKKDWLVSTRFHTRDIEFKYGMTFKPDMSPSWDSLYKFVTNLSPGQQVTVNFIGIGGFQLNYPNDSGRKTLRILAFPEPIKSEVKSQ